MPVVHPTARALWCIKRSPAVCPHTPGADSAHHQHIPVVGLNNSSYLAKIRLLSRVSEIQELTQGKEWRYVDSTIKSITDLANPSRWLQGPQFLHKPQDQWPLAEITGEAEGAEELKGGIFCGLTQHLVTVSVIDATQFSNWADLLSATDHSLQGAAASDPTT